MAPWSVRVAGGFGSYRMFVYITTLLLREVFWLLKLHCGTPEPPHCIYIVSSVGTSFLVYFTYNWATCIVSSKISNKLSAKMLILLRVNIANPDEEDKYSFAYLGEHISIMKFLLYQFPFYITLVQRTGMTLLKMKPFFSLHSQVQDRVKSSRAV